MAAASLALGDRESAGSGCPGADREGCGPIQLAAGDAATFLNLSVRTLQNWRVFGRGPSFVKIGRRVQYRFADLEAYIASCVRQPTSDQGM